MVWTTAGPTYHVCYHYLPHTLHRLSSPFHIRLYPASDKQSTALVSSKILLSVPPEAGSILPATDRQSPDCGQMAAPQSFKLLPYLFREISLCVELTAVSLMYQSVPVLVSNMFDASV